MKDLTQDSITLHILKMAGPAAITMFVVMAHQVVTLHFVSGIGTEALAAVSAAGTAGFVLAALTQILNVGTVALVSHSAGRKDLRDISVLFNQALGLGIVCALGALAILFVLAHLYVTALSDDPAVVDLGVRFLWWVAPAYALTFPMVVVGATLRGLGLVSKPMLISTLTIVIDAAFAVVLIPGRWFIPALGVEGAGLATTLSYVIGFILMLAYFRRTERGIVIQRKLLAPRRDMWRRILALGLPAAAELTLMFVSMSVIYLVIRNQGASAQAGFGVGFRILQLLLLPGLAISVAAAPIAGQNFGARNFSRVREVFRTTGILSSIVMLVVTLIVHWHPEALLLFFETDAASAATATLFLHVMSWTLVAQGLVYTCAFMFQALGNTVPALISATARFIVFAAPAIWLSYQPSFRTEHVWYLLTASIVVQAIVSSWLLQIEFRRKLQPTALEANNQTSSSRALSSYAPDAGGHVDPTKSL